MFGKNRPSQSEIDGVQYRRAKLWQIILYACNGFVGMSVYSLIGMASYSASIGYGVSTIIVGYILTATRILDAVTDPLLAFLYDKVNTRFGKLRVLLVGGFAVEAAALLCMFNFLSSKGFGWLMFTFLYIVYIIGYTITNMTAQTIPAIMTNDPKQRPIIGVWTTAFNYLVPMTMMIVLNMVLLPMFGGQYNQAFLSAACWVCVGMGAVGIVLVCIGVSAFDKPENFIGVSKKREPLKVKDMVSVLKGNRPLQCYIVAQATDKLATQTNSQAIINTLLFGIVIGNMGIATTLQAVSMLPSILFAIVGAKYAGKFGSKKTIVTWSTICMAVAAVTILFFAAGDPRQIAVMGPMMVIYIILNLALSGSMMCVTSASTAFMADVIDYELDRSGKYVPAVVTGVYSLIDKIISAFGAAIATACVALIGYTAAMPQPGDEMTAALFWMTMFVKFGMPILGWIATLAAMRFCKLDRTEMVEVQKRIADKKAAAVKGMIDDALQ